MTGYLVLSKAIIDGCLHDEYVRITSMTLFFYLFFLINICLFFFTTAFFPWAWLNMLDGVFIDAW